MFAPQSSSVTAPELLDVTSSFTSWKAIAGNENKTLADFYAFLTTPSLDRTYFFSMFDGNVVLVNNLVARKQYGV